jgi:hypothetical protein
MAQMFSGYYAVGDMMNCIIDGDTIYQADYAGNRKAIGKVQAAYDDLATTTQQYYDKLVELGVIVPPKAPEVMMAEMQGTMLEMSKIIAALGEEVKELKANGHQECACGGGANVPGSKSKRGGGRGAAGDCGDGEQP